MTKENFDTAIFFATLEAHRKSKGLTWRQVGRETGVNPSTLVRIAQGKLPDVANFVALVMWLGIPLETFWKGGEKQPASTLATISACLHSDPCLSNSSAALIDDLVQRTYREYCR